MIDLFEGAKFGDKFVTRDGKLAIYVGPGVKGAKVISETYSGLYSVYYNGQYFIRREEPQDIVGRWQEPIDEDRLDEIANAEYPSDYSSSLYYDSETDINIELREAFEKGYRKAKEE